MPTAAIRSALPTTVPVVGTTDPPCSCCNSRIMRRSLFPMHSTVLHRTLRSYSRIRSTTSLSIICLAMTLPVPLTIILPECSMTAQTKCSSPMCRRHGSAVASTSALTSALPAITASTLRSQPVRQFRPMVRIISIPRSVRMKTIRSRIMINITR